MPREELHYFGTCERCQFDFVEIKRSQLHEPVVCPPGDVIDCLQRQAALL